MKNPKTIKDKCSEIIQAKFILVHSFIRATSNLFSKQTKIPLNTQSNTIRVQDNTKKHSCSCNENYIVQHLATQV